jgi:hypothetical protein
VPFDGVPAEALAVHVTLEAGIELPDGGVKLAASAFTEITNFLPFGGGHVPAEKVTVEVDPVVIDATFVTLKEAPAGTVIRTVS